MSPELSAAVVVLGLGFVLLVVAAASGTTEVKRWLLIVIPPPVAQWRKPLGIAGGALLAVGVVLVVLVIKDDTDDKEKNIPRPSDAFAACASQLRQTGTATAVDGDAGTILRAIKVAPRPIDLVATSRAVFVAHRDGRVTRVPLEEPPGEIGPLPDSVALGERPSDGVSIAYGLEHIWVVKREENSDQGVLAKISRSREQSKTVWKYPRPTMSRSVGAPCGS